MPRTLTRTAAAILCLTLAPAAACSDPSPEASETPASDTSAPETPAPETPAPEARVTLTEVATGDAPTAGVAGPGGTLWIAERPGRVRVLDRQGLGAPVLDISDETTTDGERGLLGLAFDPDFAHLYLSYTDRGGDTVVEQLAVVDGRPRPDTRRTVLTQSQPYSNHNGGDLTFGPDGLLYVGLGDGGSGGDPQGNGQDLGTWLGTLLRVDPDTTGSGGYAVPPDNPFVDQPGARPEIWAYGLRNPWRFGFDAETDDLWIGDVGQSSLEEVDRLPAGDGAGANLGWSAMEGTRTFSADQPPDGHVPPVYEYETTAQRCSVTGGYVYRGTAIPQLQGRYLFSDYCEGDIRALELPAGGDPVETNLGVNGGSVVAFAQGPDRELYVLDLDGPVYRIDPA